MGIPSTASPSHRSRYIYKAISPSHVRVMLRETEVAARRLVRSLQLCPDEWDDCRQDLLLDLLRRIQAFDPDRGSFGAFVGTVVAHQVTRLARRLRRRMTFQSSIPVDENEIGAITARLEGNTACVVEDRSADHLALIDLRIDLVRALEGLRPDERQLCAKLANRRGRPHVCSCEGFRSAPGDRQGVEGASPLR